MHDLSGHASFVILYRYQNNSGRQQMQLQENKPNPKIIIFVNVFFAASNSIFFKLSTVPPMVFVSTRFFLCALVFLGVLIIRSAVYKKKLFEISGKRFVSLFLIGFVFSFGAYMYFIALKESALSSVLIINSSNAILVAVFSFFLLKERISSRGALAIAIAFAGCVIVALTKTNGLENSLLGNLCALACSTCCATYMVYMKKFTDINVPTKLFVVYAGSFVFAFVISLIQGNSFISYENGQPYPACEFLWILGSAILSVCISQGIINWALKYVKASFAASVSLLEPIVGAIYGYLIWAEGITPNHLIGGILVIGGLYLYNRSERHDEREPGAGSVDG